MQMDYGFNNINQMTMFTPEEEAQLKKQIAERKAAQKAKEDKKRMEALTIQPAKIGTSGAGMPGTAIGGGIAGTADMAGGIPVDQTRNVMLQNEALDVARNMAAGKGPSVADISARQMADRITRQQMAAAASRGFNPAAIRGAQYAGQQAQQQAIQAGALGRAQERMAGQQMLANVGLQAAGLGQEYGLSQQQLAQQRAIQNAQLQQQAELAAAEMQTQRDLAKMGYQFQGREAQRARDASFWNTLIGGAFGAAGGLGAAAVMASDKNCKANIKDGGKSASKFLDALEAKNYNYKGENKKRLGVMAQDMEKSEMGKKAVVQTNDGMKAIDNESGMDNVLASLAYLNKELKNLKKRRA